MFISADKTNSIYEMPAEHHEKLLKNNITKTYRNAPPKLANYINLEAKKITKNLKLVDRIEQFVKAEAFITLKDRKDSFINNPTCFIKHPLSINPSKNGVEKIIKNILDQIHKDLANHLAHNQWKNTSCVIEWFKNINEKNKCAFIQLDINEFYPSITEDILANVITFAKTFFSRTDPDLRIIKHCRRSLLFSK